MALRGFRNQGVIPLGSANGPLSVARINFSFGPAENSGGANISGMITGKFYIDIVASASVTGFVVGDITVNNGVASEFTGSGTTYRVAITPTANSSGLVDVTIEEDVVMPNNNAGYRSYSFQTSTAVENKPTVRWDLPNGIQTGQSYLIPFTFRRGASSVEVVGMDPGELDTEGISGATEAVFTQNWEFTMPSSVTSFAPSNITIAGITINSVNQAPEDATKWLIFLTTDSTTAPGRGIATLLTSQVTITGLSGVTRPTSIRSRSSNYVAQIFPPNEMAGTLNTIIRANAVTIVSDGVTGPDRDTSFGSVAFNRITPVTFTLSEAQDLAGNNLGLPIDENTWYVIINADKTASAFAVSDIVVSGACKGGLAILTANRRWRLTLSSNQVGRYDANVSIPAGAISEGNHTVEKNYSIIRESPSPIWTLPTGIQMSPFNIPITFSTGAGTTGVSQFNSNDLTVTGVSGATVELRSSMWQFRLNGDIDSIAASNVDVMGSTVTAATASGTGNRVINITISTAIETLGTITLTGLQSSSSPVTRTASQIIRRNYIAHVIPPANTEGTLNVVMQRNAVTSDQGVAGPLTSENSGSIGFDTYGTEPTVINYDWPDNIAAGAGTFFVDIDFNVLITGLATEDFILDAPSSVTISSISSGTTSIEDESDRTMRTRSTTVTMSSEAEYYRVNFAKTAAYAGEIVSLTLKSLAVRGPVYSG